ncbi:hypothetical protein B0H13DRAFT_1862611 [Mycena leptocephala]|nr:hypothetical protein B0H13DRAFT_1862611 [Mycena leptocephala]
MPSVVLALVQNDSFKPGLCPALKTRPTKALEEDAGGVDRSRAKNIVLLLTNVEQIFKAFIGYEKPICNAHMTGSTLTNYVPATNECIKGRNGAGTRIRIGIADSAHDLDPLPRKSTIKDGASSYFAEAQMPGPAASTHALSRATHASDSQVPRYLHPQRAWWNQKWRHAGGGIPAPLGVVFVLRASKRRSEGGQVGGGRDAWWSAWVGDAGKGARAHGRGCVRFDAPSLPRRRLGNLHRRRALAHATRDGTMRVREFSCRWVWSLCRRASHRRSEGREGAKEGRERTRLGVDGWGNAGWRGARTTRAAGLRTPACSVHPSLTPYLPPSAIHRLPCGYENRTAGRGPCDADERMSRVECR